MAASGARGAGTAVGVSSWFLSGLVVVVDHRRLVERQVTGEHPLGLRLVELADPVADHQRRDGVAREVGDRPRLGHEPVDADDQADAVDEVGAVRARPPARVARPAPLTPAAPFEAMIMKTSSPICSPSASGLPIASATNRDAIVR